MGKRGQQKQCYHFGPTVTPGSLLGALAVWERVEVLGGSQRHGSCPTASALARTVSSVLSQPQCLFFLTYSMAPEALSPASSSSTQELGGCLQIKSCFLHYFKASIKLLRPQYTLTKFSGNSFLVSECQSWCLCYISAHQC